MIDLRLDLRAFERKARELGAAQDQVPFALANALTAAAFRTREALITETWPRHVHVRNRSFMRAALKVQRATKRNLTVAITTEGASASGRGHLMLHAKGGAKRAVKRLAIPPSSGQGAVRRTARGVAASQKPSAVVANTPKRALRITARGIFEGRGGRLILRYAFKGTATIRGNVPFVQDFRAGILNEAHAQFPAAMAKAMKTRRG